MANPSRCGQPSSNEQRDYKMRRARSSSPNGRAERLPHNHTSLSAVNTPLRTHLSGQLWGHPFGQIFGSLEQHGASSHLIDAADPSDTGGIQRQFPEYAGGRSALGLVPEPAGYTQPETDLRNQQGQMPPEVVVTDDLNPAPAFASAGMTAGTDWYSDGLDPPDKLEPEQWGNSTVTVEAYMEAYMDPNRSIPPSLNQLREPVSTRGQNFLSAHRPWGFEPPSSPSAYSPSSASPISTFSGFGVNSPRSTMGDIEESGSSRTYPTQECRVQGEPNWGANGRVAERVPVSQSSPAWPTNQAQPFGCELFQAISSMTLASANMAAVETSEPLNTTTLPASIIEGSPLMAPISAHPQSFPTEGSDPFTCPAGGPSGSVPIDALGPALQSGQTEFLLSILPGIPDYQPSNVSGTSIINSPSSEIPVISGVAAPFFSTQVNASYAGAPYRDYTYPISSMGASGSWNAAEDDAVHAGGHAKFKSRTRGSIGKKCGRHRGTSRAKELENEDNNDLLHMSISSLEENGIIQQASALKDTLRLIIHNCFPNAPTRQEIVDLLFEVLPESIRVRVAESGVKKYYKERIGHILSAPSNKLMFINSAGRWSLGEGPSH